MAWNYAAHQGGSYTYERSILTAVATTLPQDVQKTVAVVSPTSCPSWWPRQSSTPWITLSTTLGAKLDAAPFALKQYVLGRSISQSLRDAHGRHITRFLLRHGIDVVWQISPGYPPLDVPYVATLWDLQHREQPWFPEAASGNEWWERESYYTEWLGRALRIIVPNAAAREEVQRGYGTANSRIVDVPQPVDPFHDVAAARSPEATAAEGRQLFYPAQFWPHKNHVCLLEALRQLRRDDDDRWHLVLAGSDKGTADYVRAESQRLGVANAVAFPGFVSRAALVEMYRQSFAMVFPSFFGPENLPPLEAMSFGCPVIAAAVPGASEQLGDAALLFDPLDPTSLARTIVALKNDQTLRSELVTRGYKLADHNSAASAVERVFQAINACRRIRQSWKGSWSL